MRLLGVPRPPVLPFAPRADLAGNSPGPADNAADSASPAAAREVSPKGVFTAESEDLCYNHLSTMCPAFRVSIHKLCGGVISKLHCFQPGDRDRDCGAGVVVGKHPAITVTAHR